MIKNSRKLRLPADLYSRNTLYGLLVDHIFSLTGLTTLKILDVGGYQGKLAWFLPPQAEVTILDKKEPPTGTRINYVQADATKIPFPDDHFDLVISSDMLEHVEPEKHQQILKEMLRVSKRHLIVAAPFNSIYNRKAEQFINSQFKENTGQDHPFLHEHLSNGLPENEVVESFLMDKSVSFHKIGEGHIYNWFLQQLTIGAKLAAGSELEVVNKEGEEKFVSFNNYFNENLFSLGNFRSPCYRTVYFCDKNHPVLRPRLIQMVEEKNNFHTTSYLQAYKKAFDEIKLYLQLKDSQIVQSEGQKLELSQVTHELNVQIEDLKTRLLEAENNFKLLESQLNELESILHDKENEIKQSELEKSHLKDNQASQKKTINMLDQQLSKGNEKLKLLESQVEAQTLLIKELKETTTELSRSEAELIELVRVKERKLKDNQELLQLTSSKSQQVEASLAEYKRELEIVLNSRSWKLVRIYGKFKNTFYTRPKNLISTAWQVLVKMGPSEFWQRIKRKIFKNSKARITSQNEQYEKYINAELQKSPSQQQIRKQIRNFHYQPLISIITPVYNVDQKWLRKCVESVQNQYYEKWELCLVDDASTKPHIRALLHEFSRHDSRIKIHFRQQNGGIVKTSNRALKMAKGAYVALMDNDDELAPTALFEVVNALQKQKYDFIYTDEDKMEMDGTRVEPFFKPDYDPELLFGMNYISHFAVIRRKVIEEVGGFREGTDGSQDYDLYLRLTDKQRTIHHIAKILYHWRKIPGSAAATVDAKQFAFEAAKKALQDASSRRGIKAKVADGLFLGSYRFQIEIEEKPLVSIIIPFKDHIQLLKTCLNSIYSKTTYQNYEIILVDNASELFETREYMKEIEKCPRITLLHYDAPFNFSAINNFAAQKARGEYLVLLNNDTEIIEPDWLQNMLELAVKEEIGVVGAKLVYHNNTIQHAGVVVGIAGAANHVFNYFPHDSHGYFGLLSVPRSVSAVTGALMMVSKKVYDEVGGLDEENLAVSFNDVDFCLRVREKGYRIVYTPYAKAYHYESYSRGKIVNFKEEFYLRERHSGIYLQGDPFYNPNLTHERVDYSLRVMDQKQNS